MYRESHVAWSTHTAAVDAARSGGTCEQALFLGASSRQDKSDAVPTIGQDMHSRDCAGCTQLK